MVAALDAALKTTLLQLPRACFTRPGEARHTLLLSAYVGADYLDVDQIVNGTTGLPDAFPDDDDLNVSFPKRMLSAALPDLTR